MTSGRYDTWAWDQNPLSWIPAQYLKAEFFAICLAFPEMSKVQVYVRLKMSKVHHYVRLKDKRKYNWKRFGQCLPAMFGSIRRNAAMYKKVSGESPRINTAPPPPRSFSSADLPLGRLVAQEVHEEVLPEEEAPLEEDEPLEEEVPLDEEGIYGESGLSGFTGSLGGSELLSRHSG